MMASDVSAARWAQASARGRMEQTTCRARPRAVVTGGAGFLGSHLCERLLVEGWAVSALDDLSTGSAANVAHLGELGPFELVRTDVSVSMPVDGPVDAVLHFASPASPADYLRLPIETLRVGSVGTLQALDLAQEKGARFLLASTSEVYGDPLVHPQPEGYWGNVNPIGPRAVYDEAKRFAEAATMAYRRARGVDTAIMRIFNTHGPRMRRHDGRAVPTFVRQALAGEPLTVAGDGRQTRSIQHVDDLVDGALRLLGSDLAGPVNIGNPQELSMSALAALVVELTGSASPIVRIARPVDDPELRCPDIGLAAAALDWTPRVDLREGLRRTIDWFRVEEPAANGWTAPVPGLPLAATPAVRSSRTGDRAPRLMRASDDD